MTIALATASNASAVSQHIHLLALLRVATGVG